MLSLRIALRYLFARKSHTAVNVISMISMAGVAVATMAMVAVMSVFNGFTDLAMERLSSIDPDLKVTPLRGKVIVDGDSLAMAIEAIDGVAVARPVVEEQALAMYHDRQMPVTVKGITADYDSVAPLSHAVIDGALLPGDSATTFSTISVGVALQFGATPSFYDPLTIFVPERTGRYNPANPAASFRSDSTVVSGVFEIDQAEYDADYIFMPLDRVRDLLDYYTEATAVEIAIAPGADPAAVKAAVSAAVGPGNKVADRREQQEQAFRMINIEKWVTLVMLAFILVIASFNIVSTLSMLIIEKRDNTSIMRALGAPLRLVRRVFMFEGWLVSLFGGIAGIIAGIALVLAQQHFKFIKLGGDSSMLTIDAYPVRLYWGDLVVIFAIVAAIGLVTGAVASRFVGRKSRFDNKC